MRPARPILAFALGLPLFACMMPHRSDTDSIERGRAVAQRWCAGCHLVSHDQPPSTRPGPRWASAPSFMAVAADPRVDRAYLRGLATEFYFPMPAFHLQGQDQEDVISYILSLKGQL
jgi:mono/diheme cytochrome c family protein